MSDPRPEPMLKEPGAPFTGDPYTYRSKPMPEWAQRLSVEVSTTVRNLRKLSAFVGSPEFVNLPVLDQRLMVEQRGSMEEYAKVVSLRYCMALLEHG